MNTRYYLREHTKSGQTYIWLDLRANGTRLRISSNIQVEPDRWNDKRNEIRGTDKITAQLNAKLKDIESAAHEIYQNHLKANTLLTTENLKMEVTRIISPEKILKFQVEKNGAYTNLLDLLEYFLRDNPKNLKKNTIKAYKTVSHLLYEYSQSNGKDSLDFKAIDLGFHQKFVKFLYSKNLQVNTVDKQVKWVKALMTYATEMDWNTNINYKKFRRKEEDTSAIALTEKEIEAIYELEVPAYLESAKDEFVFSCYTGLRFSDLMNLKKENWKGDFISVKTIKTEDFLDIPLRDKAKRILEKYNGELPRIPNSKYNEKIKAICSKVDSLKTLETIYSSAGNVRKEIQIMRYELVTSHTGRRSFATDCVIKGIPIPLVMNVTGHKTLSSFQKYIRISQKSNASLLLKAFQKLDTPIG
ncbi:MAG TPA: tyrosine-type recombinase/integrase [Bacteroidia bacterium]|jgi:integrase|nr:tyrosine-type recombinase/integrase [Bacteroidia bacterium]